MESEAEAAGDVGARHGAVHDPGLAFLPSMSSRHGHSWARKWQETAPGPK